MGTTEMLSATPEVMTATAEVMTATAEVMTATTATATTATTMTLRHTGVGSENERGQRNCRDERFDYPACHSGTCVCGAIAHTLMRSVIIMNAKACCSRQR
jgi:hypothetical protein